VVVVNGSATALDLVPDNSVDLIFTDPPFGANINYSEMNFLWECWLGSHTDQRCEAIVNRVQNKGVLQYEELMTQSLKECYRVLRAGHWMLLVFMNSSKEIWGALRRAVGAAGFDVKKMDIFDKQHGTFKQFVSDNTAGMDLVLHCLKPLVRSLREADEAHDPSLQRDLVEFLGSRSTLPRSVYLHVNRDEEIDFRTLYSQWLADSFLAHKELVSFADFRQMAQRWIDQQES